VVWKEKIELWYEEHIRNVRFGRDSGIFLIFLLISTLFWLLNQLSKETTARMAYPVRFLESGHQRVIVNELPRTLDLTLRGQGYVLLKYKMRPWKDPVEVDLRTFPLQHTPGDPHRYYLLTAHLKGYLSDRLGDQMRLEEVKPDTLWFVFDKRERKILPIRPDVVVVPARQYILKEPPYTEPDSLAVEGPAMVLDTLQAIPTEHAEYRDVDRSFAEKIRLQPIAGLIYPVKKVVLHVEVEQYTEAVFTLPVEVLHLPDSVELRLFPPKVKVSFRVGLGRYKKITSDMFRVTVDYRDLLQGKPSRLTVHLDKQPPRIENVRLEPERVEYIVERRRR